MPELSKLIVSGVRNLSPTNISPSKHFNVIYGENGSGKTSFLESIYLLGLGRSFRTANQTPIVADGLEVASVYGETVSGSSLGISRPAKGPLKIKVSGDYVSGLESLAKQLPLLLLNTDTFTLLEGGPQERRQFMDWGVFHVKHDFIGYWRSAKRALQHRNALLRRQGTPADILPWSNELVVNAQKIDSLRREYLDILLPVLQTLIHELPTSFPKAKISISHYCGWNEDIGLAQALQNSFEKDLRNGFTSYGPHRADLKLQIGNVSSTEKLSRGQLKLLVSVLKLAQAAVHYSTLGTKPIFLIDDLPAELDSTNQAAVCALVQALMCQTFITCIDESSAMRALQCNTGPTEQGKLFHVKHGTIEAVL